MKFKACEVPDILVLEGFRCQTNCTIKDVKKKGIAANRRRLEEVIAGSDWGSILSSLLGLGRDGVKPVVSLLSGTSHYSGIYSISLLLRLSMILGTERRSFVSCPLWVERYYKLSAHISLIIPESALKADNYYMSWWRFCVFISIRNYLMYRFFIVTKLKTWWIYTLCC